MQYKAEKLNAPPFCRIYVRIETASFNPPPLLLFFVLVYFFVLETSIVLIMMNGDDA